MNAIWTVAKHKILWARALKIKEKSHAVGVHGMAVACLKTKLVLTHLNCKTYTDE